MPKVIGKKSFVIWGGEIFPNHTRCTTKELNMLCGAVLPIHLLLCMR